MLLEKFNGSASPNLKPQQGLASRSQDIVAYAYLFKNLQFPVPFERLDLPLTISGTTIAAFGMNPARSGHAQMAHNVLILDYISEDDFVIELKTKSAADHLVLAKIKPAANLSQTIAKVQQRREAAKPVAAEPSDVLRVPKMNFDIRRSYDELLNRPLIAPIAAAVDGTQLLNAEQGIRFLMDEKGVVLLSESRMTFGCSVEAPPVPKHYMVFDKPFLLMLTHEQSKVPYFAVWVDNAELLERAAQ